MAELKKTYWCGCGFHTPDFDEACKHCEDEGHDMSVHEVLKGSKSTSPDRAEGRNTGIPITRGEIKRARKLTAEANGQQLKMVYPSTSDKLVDFSSLRSKLGKI